MGVARLHQAPVVSRHHQVHPGEAPVLQPGEERRPVASDSESPIISPRASR